MSRKMKAMLLALAVMIAVSSVAFAAATYYVTGNRVHVRSGPGTDYDILATLSRGTKIHVYSTSHGWARITLASGSDEGYMYAKYISRHKPTNEYTRPAETADNSSYRNFVTTDYYVLVNPTNSYVNMRWAASKSAQVRRVYYYGARLKVIAENAYWCQVMDESTGEVGFILKSLLLRTESANNG